jgi:hypothetical protein
MPTDYCLLSDLLTAWFGKEIVGSSAILPTRRLWEEVPRTGLALHSGLLSFFSYCVSIKKNGPTNATKCRSPEIVAACYRFFFSLLLLLWSSFKNGNSNPAQADDERRRIWPLLAELIANPVTLKMYLDYYVLHSETVTVL